MGFREHRLGPGEAEREHERDGPDEQSQHFVPPVSRSSGAAPMLRRDE
jgi:hypothetical protein